MSENILLIIKEKTPLRRKITVAPGVILESNRMMKQFKKPVSPIVGKKIILRPKPIRRRMGMNFL